MWSVARAVAVYLALLLIFRLAGKRTLSDVSTFDFVLLLIISESIQQGLVNEDSSLTNALLLVLTLVGLNVGFSALKRRYPRFERITEGYPLLVFANGKAVSRALDKERIGEEDILHAARHLHGVSSLEEVDTAVLESSGGISVVPRRPA